MEIKNEMVHEDEFFVLYGFSLKRGTISFRRLAY